MDFNFSDEDLAFGERFRSWLEENLDPDWRRKYHGTSPEWVAFQRAWDGKLYEAGWGGIFWPAEHGGMGATLAEKAMYSRVAAQMGAPQGLGKLGKRLLAPIVMAFGTPEQRERILVPILKGEIVWAQGFSEPGAGSDLASLRTRAKLEGDTFRVTGQKIWTSHAAYSDSVFALVRTNPDVPKHQGISLLLIPLDAPGVEVRTVEQIDGRKEFAEVFFDDVEVPIDDMIGPLHGGWQAAMGVLAHERGAEMSFQQFADASRSLNAAIQALSERPDAERAARHETLGRLQAGYFAMQLNAMRMLSAELDGGNVDQLPSVLKLQSSEAWRHGIVDELQLAGPSVLRGDLRSADFFQEYLHARSVTIAAGSSEIQRTIIARRVLGMK